MILQTVISTNTFKTIALLTSMFAFASNSYAYEMVCVGHDTSFGDTYTNLMINKDSDGSIRGISIDGEYSFFGTVKPMRVGKNFLDKEVITIDVSDGTAISMFKDAFEPADSDGFHKNTMSYLSPAGTNYAIELHWCAIKEAN